MVDPWNNKSKELNEIIMTEQILINNNMVCRMSMCVNEKRVLGKFNTQDLKWCESQFYIYGLGARIISSKIFINSLLGIGDQLSDIIPTIVWQIPPIKIKETSDTIN